MSEQPPANSGQDQAAPRTIAQRVGLARAEAQAYYERGLRAFAAHSYEDALADLDAAVERAPGYAELYSARGLIALEAGKLPGAKEDFEYALSLNKRQWLAHYGLGLLASERKAWKEALDYFSKAQSIAPGRPEPWYYRAVAYYNLGEMEKAAADMKTAIRWFATDDKRKSDAQKWLRAIDPNAASDSGGGESSGKAAKDVKEPGKAAKTEGGRESLPARGSGREAPKQIESGRARPNERK